LLNGKNVRPLAETAVCPVLLDQLDDPENQANMADLDATDIMDHLAETRKFAAKRENKSALLALPVDLDRLDLLDHQVMLEPQANPAAPDKTQLAEVLDQLDPRELQVRPVRKEPQVTLERPLKAHPVHPVIMELLAKLVLQVPLDPLETQVKTPLAVHPDPPDPLDPQEVMDSLAAKANQDPLVALENKENAVSARNIVRWTVGCSSRTAPNERHKASNAGRQHCLYQSHFAYDNEIDALLFLSFFLTIDVSSLLSTK